METHTNTTAPSPDGGRRQEWGLAQIYFCRGIVALRTEAECFCRHENWVQEGRTLPGDAAYTRMLRRRFPGVRPLVIIDQPGGAL